jgi:hypothetical protein
MKQEFDNCRCLQEFVFDGLIQLELTFYSDDMWWLHNIRNSIHQSIENPPAAYEVLLHDAKVEV